MRAGAAALRTVALLALCWMVASGGGGAGRVDGVGAGAGIAPARAAAPTVEYRLPLAAGASALVTQGNAGPYTHEPRGFSEFAWDFALPVGSMVTAAAGGTVVSVEQGNAGGGTEDVYRSRSNHVVIAHADGRYSVYLHLAYRGSLVTMGQRVRAGQGIALSGATGYTTGPHLHFQVQASPNVGRSWSVPVTFADVGVPGYGESPVSGNLYTPPPTAPRAADGGLTFPGLAPPPAGSVFTHQGLVVAVDWATGGPWPDVATRLVMADGEGRRTVVATSQTAGRTELRGRAVTSVPGPVTLWAEYREDVSWNVLPTASGGIACFTVDAIAHDVFVVAPGPEARAAGGGAGSESYDVTFTVVNLGSEPRRLRGLTVSATPSSPASAEAGASADAWVVTGTPSIKDVYLAPGATRTWRGSIALGRPGRYTLTPVADDSAGDPLFFPPVEVGRPATATVVVEGQEPPPPAQRFADVPALHPAAAAIEELAARGLLTGYPGPAGTRLFRPDDPVARAQFAKLMVECLGLPVAETDICPFVDVEVSGEAGLYPDNYVAVAAAAGITRGTALDPPRFSPYAPVTRGQAVTMASRAAPDSQTTIPGDASVAATRAEAAQLAAALLR